MLLLVEELREFVDLILDFVHVHGPWDFGVDQGLLEILEHLFGVAVFDESGFVGELGEEGFDVFDAGEGFVATFEVGVEGGVVGVGVLDDVEDVEFAQFVHDGPGGLARHQGLAVGHGLGAEVGGHAEGG